MIAAAVYHATSPTKLARYRATGCILPPVRFWITREAAEDFMRRTHRSVLLRFPTPDPCYPLDGHSKRAAWTTSMVREWEQVCESST